LAHAVRLEALRLPRAIFVRAAIESLPAELAGVADRLTIILPWGSLLAAVAARSLPGLVAMRALCRSHARITIVLGWDAERDRGELARLGIPSSSPVERAEDTMAGYAAAGFRLSRPRAIDAAELTRWPSTWARRLAHGRGRRFGQLEGTADDETGVYWNLEYVVAWTFPLSCENT
jgi:16S rRNA (adenine(1408)-N(1))-methyltransferase